MLTLDCSAMMRRSGSRKASLRPLAVPLNLQSQVLVGRTHACLKKARGIVEDARALIRLWKAFNQCFQRRDHRLRHVRR